MVWPCECGFVYEGGEAVLAQFGGLEAEDEEHGIDDVGLAVAVGADHAGEVRVEGAEDVPAVVGLEVLELQLVD